MFEEILKVIPSDIIRFIIVFLFALLIGLEQRRYHIKQEFESLFGTDRTFTLIGILGYILYIISPQTLLPFIGGGAIIAVLLGIYYYQKIARNHMFGITSIVIAFITYCLAPLVYTQHLWLVLLIVVVVLIITEVKETLFEFSKKFDNEEFITLAKFLVLAGVILPLLPDKPISTTINISPYKFWLAIVAVSGISYISYLLKKFIFPKSGIILSSILGGLYSSTATTIILAKKSKEMVEDSNKIAAAIMLATAMMYIRIFLLALFFNIEIAFKLVPYFVVFILVTAIIAYSFIKFYKVVNSQQNSKPIIEAHNNPLELNIALLFGTLFIFFALVTGFVNTHFGINGINILSFFVGVTDVAPFIINLFQSKWNLADSIIIIAVLNAISRNNLLKMIYGISLCDKSIRLKLISGFSILVIIGLTMSLFIHFY